jgi:hypothetical protein
MSPLRSVLSRRLLLPVLALAMIVFGASPAGATTTPRGGTFECAQPDHDWAEVAAGPNTYVTGNCKNGTRFQRAAYSDVGATSSGWELGLIGGGYQGCGTVKGNESILVDGSTGVGPYCGNDPSQSKSDYISNSDCQSGQSGNCSWDKTLHGDVTTRLAFPCTAYANARPFSPGGSTVGLDPVGTLDANTENSYHFQMRYITKDRRMVLGFLGGAVGNSNDPDYRNDISHAPRALPRWVFLESACVTIPHQQGV